MNANKRMKRQLLLASVIAIGIISLVSQQQYLRLNDATKSSIVFANTTTTLIADLPTGEPTKEGTESHTDSPRNRLQRPPLSQEVDASNQSRSARDDGTAALSDNTTECVRLATILPTRNGLGHRFTEVVMGMKFAQDVNATYLYNNHVWSLDGLHGSYKWMNEFLPLQENELTRIDPKYREQQQKERVRIVGGQWAQMVDDSKKNPCNVEIRTILYKCCENRLSKGLCWCTKDTARIGTFEAMKGRLREAFSKSKYSVSENLLDLLGRGKSNNTTAPFSVIVWHLRIGDIVLNAREEYFSTISAQIVSAFQNSTSSMVPLVVFLAEGGEKGISESFPFLPSICRDLFSDNCFYLDMDVRNSLYYMIHSDILVTSGSSFPAVAGLLRSSGMTLAARSKENVVGIYETSEQLLIEIDGTIREIGALKEYLDRESVTSER